MRNGIRTRRTRCPLGSEANCDGRESESDCRCSRLHAKVFNYAWATHCTFCSCVYSNQKLQSKFVQNV